MSAKKGNAVIGQSGGPTCVINQSLVGVIEQVNTGKFGHIDKLLGAKHGVRGIVNNDYYTLNGAPAELLERIARTPSSALGSTRDKPDAEYCKKIFANFKQNDVRYFFYIGGNDSADAARIVQEMAAAEGYELHVVHIPKTIDNDLRVNDHTPGYGSAAKFVASATIGDDYDNKSLPGIKVNVLMGRNAGFLTAAAALARKYENDGPHLIYVPEAPLTEQKLVEDVDRVYSKLGRCLIAVSEGVSVPEKNAKGHYVTWAEKMSENLEKDSHGNIQLSGTGALADHLVSVITKGLTKTGGKKLRIRADTYGYLQRSFAGILSEVDATEARAVGRRAVELSADPSIQETSVVIKRVSSVPYKFELEHTSIKNVARETKHLPPEFIKDGNDVTQAFIDYAKPLVGELPEVGSFVELKK
jgi:6-phosphofructokinase 1